MDVMIRAFSRFALPAVAAAVAATAVSLMGVAPAHAAPSCVAQSVQAEHEIYGTAWGSDVIAFLASHPEVLQEFGFASFGKLASFGAHQDRTACPPDL
jgi:hypothetical protein